MDVKSCKGEIVCVGEGKAPPGGATPALAPKRHLQNCDSFPIAQVPANQTRPPCGGLAEILLAKPTSQVSVARGSKLLSTS